MKKNLLFACLVLSTTSFAQFTDANSPQIGDGATMFVIDSFVTDMANVTGTGVTWDYSTALGVYGETKSVAVLDATTHPDASDYAGAEIAIEIPGFMTAFNTSSNANYVSKGFMFTEASFGTVKAMFNSDDEALMVYTANVGDSWTDVISGDAEASLGTFPCEGTASTIVDGSGTLKLNAATTLTGVSRFKIQDSLFVDAGFGDVIMKRTQYEYYDLANSNLPVFVHATVTVDLFGSVQTLTLVLSSAEPDGYLSTASNELANVSVYPNPATDFINVSGLTEDATIQIFALNGQLVKTVDLAVGTAKVAIDDLNAGAYIVKATTASGTLTSKVTVK